MSRVKNHDNPDSGSEQTNVADIYKQKQSSTIKGFNLADYASAKDQQPQQYDTEKFRETIQEIDDEHIKEDRRESATMSPVETAQAMMLLWLIDKLVSGICGFISTTFDNKKYSVSKEERAELVEYAGPVAAEILDKFSPAVLLLIGLGSLYGPKFGVAIKDRQEIMQKKEQQTTTKGEETATK